MTAGTASWTIRPYHKDDAEACGAVFRAAVREGAAKHYDMAQREAWAARSAEPGYWPRRLAPLHTVVATDSGRKMLGFASLNAAEAYLDLIFVLNEMRGTGLADALLDRLTDSARALGLRRLTTHASLVARSFFARHGWQEERRNTVQFGAVALDNFLMSRLLTTKRPDQ